MPRLSLLIKPISGSCNLACQYCFYRDVSCHRNESNLGKMSEETMFNLITNALLYAEGECCFAFQGGEPLLMNIDYYEKFIHLVDSLNIKKVKISYSLQTNATLINEKWCSFFKKHHFLIGVSLDGPKELHDKYRKDREGNGSFEQVMKGITLLRRFEVDFNILSVVNQDIAKHGKEVYQFFAKNGFRYLQFIPCLDEFDGKEAEYSLTSDAYLNFLNETFQCYFNDFIAGQYISIRNFDNYCVMSKGKRPEACGMLGRCASYFCVEADGSVYPCDFYVMDEYCLGNINSASFFVLADSQKAEQFVRTSLYVYEECKMCKWKNICRGGCRRHREPLKDGLPQKNRFCKAYYNFFEKNYAYIVQIANLALK